MIEFETVTMEKYQFLYQVDLDLGIAFSTYEEHVIHWSSRPYLFAAVIVYVDDSTFERVNIGYIVVKWENYIDYNIMTAYQGDYEEETVQKLLDQYDAYPGPRTIFTIEIGPEDNSKKNLFKKLNFEDKKHIYKRKPI